ncbi:hypothetical protein VCJ71_12360 [Alteriqipengyuania sp. WL0013]|uniref:hypothetical protein n=1 Tax=Alteriqipengyuania sp. WL0013 TaxID=3110773 RepID=UPI002BB20FC6|nr:hypothetical protein [Alteriqipengyuania sp. WL0013]MEB3416855.1 hypothetical protein [Alteriqipengyuania sp. WL0013]
MTDGADSERGLVTRLLEDEEKRRRHLPRIGFVLTGLYLGGLVVYLWVQGQNPATLDLNELGDFLGGVSSPLAFLWLVLGFFQSSREIGISSKALHLQAREMRAEMDEQRRVLAAVPPDTGADAGDAA